MTNNILTLLQTLKTESLTVADSVKDDWSETDMTRIEYGHARGYVEGLMKAAELISALPSGDPVQELADILLVDPSGQHECTIETIKRNKKTIDLTVKSKDDPSHLWKHRIKTTKLRCKNI